MQRAECSKVSNNWNELEDDDTTVSGNGSLYRKSINSSSECLAAARHLNLSIVSHGLLVDPEKQKLEILSINSGDRGALVDGV